MIHRFLVEILGNFNDLDKVISSIQPLKYHLYNIVFPKFLPYNLPMKFIENLKIAQRDKEHPRRVFSDSNHFDLYTWYNNPSFDAVIGFQLIYRANPFNTDDEYFFTFKPETEENIQKGKTGGSIPMHPAPKLILKTKEKPPESFFKDWNIIKATLPSEVLDFVQDKLNSKAL